MREELVQNRRIGKRTNERWGGGGIKPHTPREDARQSERVQPEAQLEETLQIPECLSLAKGEHWRDVVAVLQRVFDEALTLLDVDAIDLVRVNRRLLKTACCWVGKGKPLG